ncbi:MAG: hypothetical protein L6Q75_19000 [Burkholderiaceae bacterium]|nr:hypothetical protein [Burkholderiaceae bacterium]
MRPDVSPIPNRRALLLAGLGSLLAGPVAALDRPRGRVILSIGGRIAVKNAGERAEFDMAMLAALPQHSFTTRTPWHEGPRKFTGPLLRDVLNAVGASGSTLQAVALNDYKVALPVADCRTYPVLLARLLDDQPMPVREKGPLFIVYPFDSDAALRSERYYSRSAWQLKHLEVE